jgi:hypothetical protein
VLRVARAGERHRLAAHQQAARIGRVDAGEHEQQRALAGAVLADDGVHLAALDGEVHAVQSAGAREGLAEPFQGDRCDGVGHGYPSQDSSCAVMPASTNSSDPVT